MTREPRALWLLLIAACAGYSVFAATFSATFTAISGLSRWTLKADSTAIYPYLIVLNMVLWTSWALLAPIVFGLGRRFPFDRHRWRRSLAVHIPASLLLTTLHLVIVATARFLLQTMRGGHPEWAATVFDSIFRMLDLALPAYWALIGLQHAIDYYQQARARAVNSARLETRLAEAQLQALRRRLHPQFLLKALRSIAKRVRHDPDAADLMIERLSDILRSALSQAGELARPTREPSDSERAIKDPSLRRLSRLRSELTAGTVNLRAWRTLWVTLLAIGACYSVFATLVSVWFTRTTGVSLWSLQSDHTTSFLYILSINLVVWSSWVLFAPVAFALGRRFRFDRRGWKGALAAHIPAALAVTSLHLALVGSGRFALQRLFDVPGDWWPTITQGFFRAFDYELPIYCAFIVVQHATDYYRQVRAREVRAARLETRLVVAQLQALQQQLHPHFLFNTLHAISTLVHRDAARAEAMIGRLGELLRMTLQTAGVQEVPLSEELDYLRAYLEIEQVHFGDRLRIEHRIDAAAVDVMVPTLILQPLVENAIRHGLEPLPRAGILIIDAHVDGDTLWLRVRDNGRGLHANAQSPLVGDRTAREGVGVSNTRSRLDRLYGNAAGLCFKENTGGGVVAELRIPVITPVRRSPAEEAVA